MSRRPGGPWKRADVTPAMLCLAIESHGMGALDALCSIGIPAKVLLAAVHRDTARGYINWGVSPWRPFLDRRGRMDITLFKEDETMQRDEKPPVPASETSAAQPADSGCREVQAGRSHEVTIETFGVVGLRRRVVAGDDSWVAAALRAYADQIDPPKPPPIKLTTHR